MKLAAGLDDRLARLDEVGHVVERVVEPEDVDSVLGRAPDEPAHDVRRHGLRPDEEPPAQSEPERRRRARVDRADPLPGALDAAPHGRVEDAAPRHLEARETRAVEDLCDAEHLARGDAPGKRLLRQQPDRGVVELGHAAGPYRLILPASCPGRSTRRSRCDGRRDPDHTGRGERGAIGTNPARICHGPVTPGPLRSVPREWVGVWDGTRETARRSARRGLRPPSGTAGRAFRLWR